MRTAGIDYDMGRVVICSVPLGGEGIKDAVFTEELISRDASVDLAQRYKALHQAARTMWATHLRAAQTDVLSVCVEQPGSGQPHIGLKLYGCFAAVSAATPTGIALCSMTGTEWKSTLGLPPNKLIAHGAFYKLHEGQYSTRPDEHATDALCIAVAWRKLQQEES